MEQKLYDAASRLPEPELELDAIEMRPVPTVRPLRRVAAIAACIILVISVALGTYGCAKEAQEYNTAVQFFNDHGLPTEGLTRGEIKAVYRDITTNSFTYSKTAEVLENSLSTDRVEGWEIFQVEPTPEDLENLWNYKNNGGYYMISTQKKDGIHYKHHTDTHKESRTDPELGNYLVSVVDAAYLEKYDGDTLVWTASLTEFYIWGYQVVSDGVLVYGNPPSAPHQDDTAWLAKIDDGGKVLWVRMLDHGFSWEDTKAIIENDDGSYAVITRGDFRYFCLGQYSPEGEELYFRTTEIGHSGISNAVRFGDGYLVQLSGSIYDNSTERIVMVDREGNFTESFSYSSEDAYYSINDMIEYDGNIYLSASAVPQNFIDYLPEGGLWQSDADAQFNNAAVAHLRSIHTAVLLVCDPNTGIPQEFFSVNGSVGGELSISGSGMLLWNVKSIITVDRASPYVSSHTFSGNCQVFRYTFDNSGRLVRQEKTDEIVRFWR